MYPLALLISQYLFVLQKLFHFTQTKVKVFHLISKRRIVWCVYEMLTASRLMELLLTGSSNSVKAPRAALDQWNGSILWRPFPRPQKLTSTCKRCVNSVKDAIVLLLHKDSRYNLCTCTIIIPFHLKYRWSSVLFWNNYIVRPYVSHITDEPSFNSFLCFHLSLCPKTIKNVFANWISS